MAIKQTAGRDALGTFAPKFAPLNDEVLFGEVWSREAQLSLRDHSLVTVVALRTQGLVDESFRYPNYWGTMPMAVYTFLERCDLTGKTVHPFCTHEGSGVDGARTAIEKWIKG